MNEDNDVLDDDTGIDETNTDVDAAQAEDTDGDIGKIETDEEENEVEAQAAFDAGFSEVSPEDSNAIVPEESDIDPDPVDESENDDSEEQAPDEESEENITLTKEKYAQLISIEERMRKVEGRQGELNDRLSKVGQPRKITAENLKRVADEYGNEFAESLAQDLNDISGIVEPDNMKADLEEFVSAKIAEAQGEITQQQELTIASPGWRKKLGSDEYGEYMKNLPEEEQEKFLKSNDVDYLADEIKKFDDWKAEKLKKAEEKAAAEEKAKADRDKKHERLERNISPTKGAKNVKPQSNNANEEEAAFAAGFNEVRGGSG